MKRLSILLCLLLMAMLSFNSAFAQRCGSSGTGSKGGLNANTLQKAQQGGKKEVNNAPTDETKKNSDGSTSKTQITH